MADPDRRLPLADLDPDVALAELRAAALPGLQLKAGLQALAFAGLGLAAAWFFVWPRAAALGVLVGAGAVIVAVATARGTLRRADALLRLDAVRQLAAGGHAAAAAALARGLPADLADDGRGLLASGPGASQDERAGPESGPTLE